VYSASFVVQSGGSNYSWVYLHQGLRYDQYVEAYQDRRRWYSPTMMRFTSDDPSGFAAGDAALYRYVGDNPVNWVDPSGLDGEKDWRWSNNWQSTSPPNKMAIYWERIAQYKSQPDWQASRARDIQWETVEKVFSWKEHTFEWKGAPLYGPARGACESIGDGRVFQGSVESVEAATDFVLIKAAGKTILKAGGRLFILDSAEIGAEAGSGAWSSVIREGEVPAGLAGYYRSGGWATTPYPGKIGRWSFDKLGLGRPIPTNPEVVIKPGLSLEEALITHRHEGRHLAQGNSPFWSELMYMRDRSCLPVGKGPAALLVEMDARRAAGQSLSGAWWSLTVRERAEIIVYIGAATGGSAYLSGVLP
jgi:RHS repeat-associated protein